MNRDEAIEILKTAKRTKLKSAKELQEKGLIPSVIADAVLRLGEALEEGIRALEETRRDWIPVEQDLPDSDRPVLVTIQWTDFDREVTVGEYWDNPTKAAPESEKGWGTYGDHVTAWREMPEPWRGERERNERRCTR